MACDDLKLIVGSLQSVSPFLQRKLYCQELTVADVIILLRWGQLFGIEGTWIEALWVTLQLGQYSSISNCGSVNFHDERQFWVRMVENWRRHEGFFEALEGRRL